MTYAIVPPQVDRSQPAHRHPEPFLHPGVVRETDGGIVVRGAHAIATSATMADWLFVSYITPLVPGDEDYAISLVMPMNAEGLRLYPRRPFASMATSVFDYPLSSRFDEVDTTVVFDDVFVPWEQVFIYRNVDLVNAQFHESPSHTTANFQALVRFGVKLELMAGLAMRLAEIQKAEGDAGIQAALGGDIAALCAAFDALVKAAERFPLITGGVARPHPQYIYAGHESPAAAHRGHDAHAARAGGRRVPDGAVVRGGVHERRRPAPTPSATTSRPPRARASASSS